jgi:hypothetical protein
MCSQVSCLSAVRLFLSEPEKIAKTVQVFARSKRFAV